MDLHSYSITCDRRRPALHRSSDVAKHALLLGPEPRLGVAIAAGDAQPAESLPGVASASCRRPARDGLTLHIFFCADVRTFLRSSKDATIEVVSDLRTRYRGGIRSLW